MQTLTKPLEDPVTTTDTSSPDRPVGDPMTLLGVRLLAVGALIAAAYIHLALAIEQGLADAPVTMAQMFAVQAAAMILVAALLLFGDRSRFWLVAVAVAVGSAVPLLASVYLPLPAIGIFPPINEPVWYVDKVLSFAAELAVPALWLIRRIAPPPR